MRLTEYQQNSIVEVIDSFIKSARAELKLYGSRADDNKKGGDIDLLLIVTDASDAMALQKSKPLMVTRIHEKLGERKVDLLICSPETLGDDPFIKMVLPSSISLHTWA